MNTTTTSGIDWNVMLGLLSRLKKDKKYREYLLIGTGCFLGLRAGDLLNLKWIDLYDKNELKIVEQKTGKMRRITINDSLKEILQTAISELIRQGQFNLNDYLFQNRWNNKLSIQYVIRLLNNTFINYNVKVQNGSTHTLRKTFGKRVWEMDNKSERSLIYLSQIFNHSNTQITRRYIGIVQEDIKNIYLSL